MSPVSALEPNPLRPICDQAVNTCSQPPVWFTGDVRAVVLSDTHLRDDGSRRLPDQVYTALRDADVVLHCGDVVERGLLRELATFAPVHAVLGNNDVTLRGTLPERLLVELDGVRIGMVHDSGLTKGRPARVHRMFSCCASNFTIAGRVTAGTRRSTRFIHFANSDSAAFGVPCRRMRNSHSSTRDGP